MLSCARNDVVWTFACDAWHLVLKCEFLYCKMFSFLVNFKHDASCQEKLKTWKQKFAQKRQYKKTVETNDSDPLETAFLSTTFRRERNVFPTFDNAKARTASRRALRCRLVNITYSFLALSKTYNFKLSSLKMQRKDAKYESKTCQKKRQHKKAVNINDSVPLETALLWTTFRRQRNVFPTFDNAKARTASRRALRCRLVNITFFLFLLFQKHTTSNFHH